MELQRVCVACVPSLPRLHRATVASIPSTLRNRRMTLRAVADAASAASGRDAATTAAGQTPRNGPSRDRAPATAGPVAAARKKMGYKNKWHRQEVDLTKQVVWTKPLRDEPTVAIIGGGLAGLCCSQELAQQGIRSVVFDTGEHGTGGRLATRSSSDKSIRSSWAQQPPANMVFDHGAQFFTCSDPRFQQLVDEWQAAGAVRAWQGPVGTLKGGQFQALPPASPTRYVAANGMRSLAKHLEGQLQQRFPDLVEVRRPMWVSSVQTDMHEEGWYLRGEGKGLGRYDAVVVAHNGKCANRLIGPIGAPLVAQQLMKLKLSAVWAVMVAFDKPLGPIPFEGAFVEDSPVLSWAANNTAKLGLQHNGPDVSCWTLISTNTFGQRNKVPQEAVPEDVQKSVAEEMLRAFAAALGRPYEDLPVPVFARCQLWGAALPLNSPSEECILDPLSRVGVAGDWCAGSSMQAAAVSGISLARHLGALRGKEPAGPEVNSLKRGLTTPFSSLSPAAPNQLANTSLSLTRTIGQFPA